MKVYLTAPFDDNGVEEIDVEGEPSDAFIVWNGGRTWARRWYKEGFTWHRDREAAIAKAKEFRDARIFKGTQEISRLAQLPEIAV